MLKKFYFLAPVEAVKVTSQNLAEVAEWCGGTVASTESRKVPGRMDSYVWVPTPKGTAITCAFPGMFVTKRLVRSVKNDELKATYAVFRKDYFEKNYFDEPLESLDATWGKYNKPKKPKAAPETDPAQVRVEDVGLTINLIVQDGKSVEEVEALVKETLGGTVVPAVEQTV